MKVTLRSNNAIIPILGIVVLWMSAAGKPYEELVPHFDRIESPVCIRKIASPTRANLDYAAYDRNPMLVDPPVKTPKKKPAMVTRDDLTFGRVLATPVMSINETPLSLSEKDQPLAWKPFIKRAWDIVKDDHLSALGTRIASFKWADSAVFQPYQEISTIYLHHAEGGRTELWVKVEFAHWATFFSGVTDEDDDGIKEIYGRLSVEKIPSDSLSKLFDWIRNDYTKTVINDEQAKDWVTDLASYWYPTRNTDLIDLAPDSIWPDGRIKKRVRQKIGKVTVRNPLAVIEGKPVSPDRPVYNVFFITLKAKSSDTVRIPLTAIPASEGSAAADSTLSENYLNNNQQFSREHKHYGSYRQWELSNRPFYTDLRAWLATFPEEQMGLPGVNGWLFFRKSIDYILGGDLELQCDTMNPLPHIVMFNNYLQYQGIDLLFIAVPNKEEVYFDNLDAKISSPVVPLVNPYGRKFLNALQQSGVEVIDLLPLFLKAKAEDSPGEEYLYQKQDTHWSNRGLQIAAQAIADRIKTSSWYKSYKDTVNYYFTDTTIERLGDLVDRLPQSMQASYMPRLMAAQRVRLPDGTGFQGNQPASPILLIGDSFTGVFELIDGKSAGVGAHIAAKCRIPVDIITSWGGGPMVRQKMIRSRGNSLDHKKVILYMMVARDLYKYAQGWEPLHENNSE